MKLSKAQPLGIEHNVSINVVDERTGCIVQHHEGHNAATNSMITGIAKYLVGDGVFNQGKDMLRNYIPQYISLGVLGLSSQDEDADGLPAGIGPASGTEAERFSTYMAETPGYGADGYSINLNNNRLVFGLGLPFTSYSTAARYGVGDLCTYKGVEYVCTVPTSGSWNSACWAVVPDADQLPVGELISPIFPRARIAYREVVPEQYSELPCTMDVIFSAMISTGALRQFRDPGHDYIFITEAGLWSRPDWEDNGANGLIAGYRIAPPSKDNWAMSPDSVPDDQVAAYIEEHPGVSEATARGLISTHNREILKQNIIRVGLNQVVQVIWKVQIGSIEQFGGMSEFYHEYYNIRWEYGG